MSTPATLRKAWTRKWEKEVADWLNKDKRAPAAPAAQPLPSSKRIVTAQWEKRWHKNKKPGEERGEPAKGQLALHSLLQKAESAVITQMRTRCIGFLQFLRNRRVPSAPAALCRCGGGPENAKHVAIHCALEDERRNLLYAGSHLDYHWLTNTPEGCKKLSKWFIQSGRLGQFSLASQLLYPA